jgi:O-antigen/teichoic acid export membrane protein
VAESRTPPNRKRLVAGYTVIPVITAITPFLVFPVLARVAGVDAWVAIAVGQSVGAFVALAVSVGLNVVGPTLVAEADPTRRHELLRDGTRARLVVLPAGLVIAALISWVLSPPSNAGLAAVMSVALVLNGMSAAWYLIGVGRPGLFVSIELIPKAIATGLGGALLVWTGSAIWYPVLLIVVALCSFVGFTLSNVRARELLRPGLREVFRFFARRWEAALTETIGGAYATLTVSLVGGAATPTQAAAYVSGDKFFKLGQTIIGTMGNAFQARVASANGPKRRLHAAQSSLAHFVLGGSGFVAFVLLGPPLTALLFGSDVALETPTAAWFGVAAWALSMNTSIGRHVLLPAGHARSVLISVVVGAAVGVPSIILLARSFGAAGGAAGLAISESLVLIVQILAVMVFRRSDEDRLRARTV